MSRNLYRLSYLLLATALQATLPAQAGTPPTISFADQPVRLLRGTSFYGASRGAHLETGDILDTGASNVQIEGVGDATLALGPASRVYFTLGQGAPELHFLSGWLKIQAGKAGAASATGIASGALKFVLNGGSVIVHNETGKTELFVEDGELAVTETQAGKAARTTKIAREQYAVRNAETALKLLPRAPKQFLGGMPHVFLDMLVPVSIKGAAPAPKMDAPASYAQVASWLTDAPAVRQTLQRRFNPPPKKTGVGAPR